MKKYIPILMLTLFLFLTHCWIFKGKVECDIKHVSTNMSFEIRADGKKWAVFFIIVRNNGTKDCSCTLTIDANLADKYELNIGKVSVGEVRTIQANPDILYENTLKYTINIKCDPT